MATSLDLIRRRSALSRGLVAERSPDTSVAERGWQRMATLLAALGNPQLGYRTVHIAGSKGKGTTTYFTSALLESAGLRTGRYVSPHLLRWNERIAVDGQSITDTDFERLLTTVDREMTRVERDQPEQGSFNSFELLTAAAFIHFSEQRCDAAVIEVGLGGRFDSTNHLQPAATVITRIELEHADILGPTLVEIAWNKAGIIRPGVPVIATAQDPSALRVIEREAETAAALVLLEGRNWAVDQDGDSVLVGSADGSTVSLLSPLPGRHNQSNLGAAVISAQKVIGDRFDAAAASKRLEELHIPGRFDWQHDPHSGRALILDGAHTPGSIAALIETATEVTSASRFPVVLSLLADKPAAEIVAVIAPHASAMAFPVSANPRAWQPVVLLDLAHGLGLSATASDSLRDAIEWFPPGPEPVLVTGSFGIVAEALLLLSDTS